MSVAILNLYQRAMLQRQRAANDPPQVSTGTGNTTVAPNTNPPMQAGSVNVAPRWRVARDAMLQQAAPRFTRASADQNNYTFYQSLRAYPRR